MKFIEGGKGSKKERKVGKKDRQRKDSGKREEQTSKISTGAFSNETLMSMQPNMTYIDPETCGTGTGSGTCGTGTGTCGTGSSTKEDQTVGDVRRSRIGNDEDENSETKREGNPSNHIKSTPKEKANMELKESGIEIDESEIQNGIITITCHKASALAAAEEGIKELKKLRAHDKSKNDTEGIAVNSKVSSSKAVSSKAYDAPTHKCVGHDHEHHGKKGGKASKKDLNKKSDGGGVKNSKAEANCSKAEASSEEDKIVEKVTVPDQVVDLMNHFKAYGAVPDQVYLNRNAPGNRGSKDNAIKRVPVQTVSRAILENAINAIESQATAEDNSEEEEEIPPLVDQVENLSNRFRSYGTVLDKVYHESDHQGKISSKKDDEEMSDAEDGGKNNSEEEVEKIVEKFQETKKKLARLSTVLKNHRGNLNKGSDETTLDSSQDDNNKSREVFNSSVSHLNLHFSVGIQLLNTQKNVPFHLNLHFNLQC